MALQRGGNSRNPPLCKKACVSFNPHISYRGKYRTKYRRRFITVYFHCICLWNNNGTPSKLPQKIIFAQTDICPFAGGWFKPNISSAMYRQRNIVRTHIIMVLMIIFLFWLMYFTVLPPHRNWNPFCLPFEFPSVRYKYW